MKGQVDAGVLNDRGGVLYVQQTYNMIVSMRVGVVSLLMSEWVRH